MEKSLSVELLGLLDSGSFSASTLKKIERQCFELATRYNADTEEHAVLSTIGLCALHIADRLDASNNDARFCRFLENQLGPPLR